jgi:hypothetical protein
MICLSLEEVIKKTIYKKAFEIVVAQENDSFNRVNLFKVANRYYNIYDQKDIVNSTTCFGAAGKDI